MLKRKMRQSGNQALHLRPCSLVGVEAGLVGGEEPETEGLLVLVSLAPVELPLHWVVPDLSTGTIFFEAETGLIMMAWLF